MLRTRIRAGLGSALIISLVSAVLWTLVHSGDRFISSWTPHFGEPAHTTLRLPYGPRIERDAQTGRAELHYVHEDVLVARGVVLQPHISAHRVAYAQEQRARPPSTQRLLGVFAIFFSLALALTAYLRKFGQNRLKLLRTQVGLFIVLGVLLFFSKLGLLFTSLPELWLPVSALPLWVATAFDRRTAFLVTMISSFIVASLMQLDLILLSVLLTRGMAATLLYLDRKHPRHMVFSGLLGGLCAALVYVAISYTVEGSFDFLADLKRLASSDLLACVGGGVVSGAIAALLRSFVARVLGQVPRERLLDLTDLEQPLLTRLATEAPGTWEHSRAMANLAEQAASAIGADALLTRVGAYYHDIGKTIQRSYFVENLGPDEQSPHDELDPEVSADAIMAHVVVGTKLMREGGLPEPVVEFAYTHHGTQLVEYFWNKCLQQGNPKELDESAFRYPGMKPQTKETAILMVVDSIEAASRTVETPNRDTFEAMIQRIVFTKLASGQLDESGLELMDMRIIINRMTDTLVNMNHHRIKYQWQAKRAEEFGVPSSAMNRPSAPEIQIHGSSTMPPSLPPGSEEAEAENESLNELARTASSAVRRVRDDDVA
ncbi:MAG: HDIG domain-containing protein [Polyangiaceae bacterium]|nr:HDIG domain-containing protein [Polyangiaceae bacterium]